MRFARSDGVNLAQYSARAMALIADRPSHGVSTCGIAGRR